MVGVAKAEAAGSNGPTVTVGVTTAAANVGESGVGVEVAGREVGEGEGRGSAVGVGTSGVSVTAGRSTIVGVAEVAAALSKIEPQPVNKISKIKDKAIKVNLFVIGPPSAILFPNSRAK